MQSTVPRLYLLPVIVLAQFAGTSLWFAGNAILPDIHPAPAASGNITSMVQLGFIAGTFAFSLGSIADRYKASLVFFISTIIAASANLSIIWFSESIPALYALRFITGFFLAGIYPVGMKIAADCFPTKLGNALGFLVGALVLGTAFPYMLHTQLYYFSWQDVLMCTSFLAVSGGLLIYLLVPQRGIQKNKLPISFHYAFAAFRSPNFRAAAFGYFGHMWELYAFWAFTPVLLHMYNLHHQNQLDVSLWSFIVISTGSLGCVAGGLLSRFSGSRQVAFYALLVSGCCCLLSPLLFYLPIPLFITLLMIWGLSVVTDSPQFSTLVAQSATAENKGTALTIVTCIGFTITIASIQLMKPALDFLGEYGFLVLFPGPLFGLISMRRYFPEK